MAYFAAERHVPVPTKDLLSWTFDDPPFDQDEPVLLNFRNLHVIIANIFFQIYIDAKDPSRSVSSNQARVLIRKLVAGLQAAGLKKGDCVCLHSFNDVGFLVMQIELHILTTFRSTIPF